MDTWIRNFIWSGDVNVRKVCTVSWRKNSNWLIGGTSEKVRFWNDKWLEAPLVELPHLPLEFCASLTAPVSSFVVNGVWRVPDCITKINPVVAQQIKHIILPKAQLPDRLVRSDSKDGTFSAKYAASNLSVHAIVQ
ncbi:hypothetical protein A2U01_0019013, partial [Trifolium medium]|nr:hypothetical protein [Trifolium medium]